MDFYCFEKLKNILELFLNIYNINFYLMGINYRISSCQFLYKFKQFKNGVECMKEVQYINCILFEVVWIFFRWFRFLYSYRDFY